MAQLLELIYIFICTYGCACPSTAQRGAVLCCAVQDEAPCTEAQGRSAVGKGPNSHLAQENTAPFLLTSWFYHPACFNIDTWQQISPYSVLFAVAPRFPVLVLSTTRIVTATRSLALILHSYCTLFVFYFTKQAGKVNSKTEHSLPAPSAAADPAQPFFCWVEFPPRNVGVGRGRWVGAGLPLGPLRSEPSFPSSLFPKGLGRLLGGTAGRSQVVVGKNLKPVRTNLGLPV